jgi:UDP-glucose 4-epimerase
MKRVLVTGGAGFIGSHIVDELLKLEYEVSIIDNLSKGKLDYVNKKAKFYQKDICENLEEIFLLEKPDFVIHCAAQVMLRKSLESPLEDAKINILGTINLLESCKKFNVKKFIYCSTGGARVGDPKYLPVDEKHPINPISPYGISKHTAEHYVEMYGKLYNLDYLIFCFGNVYGPRDDPSSKRVTSIFIFNMLNNKEPIVFGDGNQTRDFIYVKDLAKFIAANLEKSPKNKLFHLANGQQISVNKVFSILKFLLSYSQEPIYQTAIKGEVRDIVLDTTLAKKELGWKPRYSLEQGLKETLGWFKETQKKA